MKKRPILAFLACYGPETRAFGYSGLLDRLSRDCEPFIVTVRPESEGFSGSSYPVVRGPFAAESRMMERVRGLSRRLRARGVTGGADGERKIARVAGGSPGWRRFFVDHQVDALVTTSYSSARTLPALQTAVNMDLPSVVLLNSWKDVSAKPYAPAHPSALGAANTDELDRFDAANPDFKGSASVMGSLHLSAILSQHGKLRRADFCHGLALDPARPILCYVASAGRAAETESAWVRALAQAVKQWPFRPQLLVRANPMAAQTHFDAETVWRPDWEWDRQADWCCPSIGDLRFWAAALDHADALISAPSTVSMEASAVRRPVVNLVAEPLWRQAWEAPFYSEAREGGWVTAASSIEEVEGRVTAILEGARPSEWPRTVDALAIAEKLIRGVVFQPTALANRAA